MGARFDATAGEPRTRLKLVTLFTPTRLAMLEAIHARPGLSASEVARAIGRHPATMWSNVHLLLQSELVRSERIGRRLCLFPAAGLSERERFLARLGPSAFVCEAIERGVPGRPVPIAHECGISRHAARSHLSRLARLGLLRTAEQGVFISQRVYIIRQASETGQ